MQVLPEDIREPLVQHQKRASLLEVLSSFRKKSSEMCSHWACTIVRRNVVSQVVLDLGRRPEARFLGVGGGEYLRDAEVPSKIFHMPRMLMLCLEDYVRADIEVNCSK